jgi:polar amino acid transport system substrate-binding protein
VRTADIGKLQFSTFDDLSGHNVAVLEAVPGLREQPAMVAPELVKFLRAHHNMIEVPNPTAAFRMLAAGHVDYAAADLPYGTYVIAKMGLTGKFQPLQSRSVNEVGLYVCFSKARFSPSFVETFSRTLGEFKKTEAYDLICRKYFTQKCTP